MLKMSATTWASAQRGLPSRRPYQKDSDFKAIAIARYSVSGYYGYYIHSLAAVVAIIYIRPLSFDSDLCEQFISPCGACRQFMREVSQASNIYSLNGQECAGTTVTCNIPFFMLSLWWELGGVLIQTGWFLHRDDCRRTAA